ncbi:DNA topoisomerase 2 [Quercus suber]|uniref:DNA topoisomerase 2 n=1 Tax=Quercus suber TaxID=58331 RepID=UPI000CE1FD8A|nr:DNA topoisomerase 2-like [Quercus suber]POE90756.1 dna topoisomerase 2 [Quercus suber]
MVVEKKRPLQPSPTANVDPTPPLAMAAPTAATKNGKIMEEMYQKKSQLEHILLRPDTYIGLIEKHMQSLWVYKPDRSMVHRPVTFIPGLCKIFDKILVNAANNKQRDPKMDSLKVVIDVEENRISLLNNGDGVPVEMGFV